MSSPSFITFKESSLQSVLTRVVILFVALNLSGCFLAKNVTTEERSASGLGYTLVNMPGVDHVSIQLAWPSNWIFSRQSNKAVPYIGTQLLFTGGAQGYPAGKLEELLGGLDSKAYVTTTVEHIMGTIHYSSEHQDETLQAINSHLREPLLDTSMLEGIRNQFALEVKQADALPETQGFDALRWALFGEQTIRAGLSLDETNVIESVTRDEVLAWAKSVFKRNGVIITIAGDLTSAEAGEAIDLLFKDVPQGEDTIIKIAEIDFSPKRMLLHAPESTTSTLSFIGQLPPLQDNSELEELLLVAAWNEYWNHSQSEVGIDKFRTSYPVRAEISAFTAGHRFVLLSGAVEASQIAAIEQELGKAYKTFRSKLPLDNLAQLKEPYKKQFKKTMNNTGSNSNGAIAAKLHGMDPARALELQDALKSITAQDLSRRMQTAFPRMEDFIVFVDSPNKNALPDACVIESAEYARDC